MIPKQKTLKKEISFSGVGLHSGETVKISLIPRKSNSGITFNIDGNVIRASWKLGKISQLCTQIQKDKITLSTIEHLMSSLSGSSIDNLEIKTNSNEMPILDGSAKDYIDKIFECGLCENNDFRKHLKVKKKVVLEEKNKFITIEPINEKKLIIDYTIKYNDEFIKKQNLYYEHSEENFKKIYNARTFCLHQDLEKIFSMGLARGGSLDNAIVVSGQKILNQGGLRYKDEFVRHKILDCIGDLYLAEYPIWGKVTVHGGGHELNLKILQKLFKDRSNYKII